MIRTILYILLLPIISFTTSEKNPSLTLGGMFFMGASWCIIITWNIVCFVKLFSKEK